MEQIIESEKSKRKEEEKQQILLKERDEKLKKEVEKEREDIMVKNQKIKVHLLYNTFVATFFFQKVFSKMTVYVLFFRI